MNRFSLFLLSTTLASIALIVVIISDHCVESEIGDEQQPPPAKFDVQLEKFNSYTVDEIKLGLAMLDCHAHSFSVNDGPGRFATEMRLTFHCQVSESQGTDIAERIDGVVYVPHSQMFSTVMDIAPFDFMDMIDLQ